MEEISTVQLVLRERLVAIVRLDDLTHAEPLVRAMLAGGIRALEFTLTNVDTPAVVRELLNQFPEFRSGQAALGIGSVRTVAEATVAIDSGAQFLVSPITVQAILREAQQAAIPCFPGAYTPTEVAQADQWGAQIVKLFPAKGLGPSYVKDLLAPMPYLKLMPTGGVDLKNMSSYFAAGAVAVGIGGQLFNPQWIAEKAWQNVELAARQHAQAASLQPQKGV